MTISAANATLSDSLTNRTRLVALGDPFSVALSAPAPSMSGAGEAAIYGAWAAATPVIADSSWGSGALEAPALTLEGIGYRSGYGEWGVLPPRLSDDDILFGGVGSGTWAARSPDIYGLGMRDGSGRWTATSPALVGAAYDARGNGVWSAPPPTMAVVSDGAPDVGAGADYVRIW